MFSFAMQSGLEGILVGALRSSIYVQVRTVTSDSKPREVVCTN